MTLNSLKAPTGLAAILMFVSTGRAHATAQGLPWETPLTTIQNSLTGPVAVAISIAGIMIAGAVLLFGGEINEFARRLFMVVLVVALVSGAVTVFNTLFTTSGASIGISPDQAGHTGTEAGPLSSAVGNPGPNHVAPGAESTPVVEGIADERD